MTGLDSFAIYRLPRAGHCTLVGQVGMPACFSSLKELGGKRGFVIAPFTAGKDMPVLLLQADVVKQCSPDEVAAMQALPCHLDGCNLPVQSASREAYHKDFCRFHRTFSETGFQKLVLARCADITHNGTQPVKLFSRACKLYPDAFVTLFSTLQSGTWLIATPEVLLARDGNRWRTMALAGTMNYSEQIPQWSEKNVHEQAYVSQYIKACLEILSNDISISEPYTVRAGNLVHLRTDFSFSLAEDAGVGEMLEAMHPTPAVCGLPKDEAHRFIVENETCNRSYYSGFSGPLDLNGDTAMFVSLRCMRILKDHYRLYAGGGILPQSEEEQEWRETEAKMQAMLSLVEEKSHELQ